MSQLVLSRRRLLTENYDFYSWESWFCSILLDNTRALHGKNPQRRTVKLSCHYWPLRTKKILCLRVPCWTQEWFCMIDAWMLSVISGCVTSVYLLLNYWENSYFRLAKASVNRLCAGNLLQIIFQNRILVLLFSEICMPAKCHIIFPAPFLLSWMKHSPYLPQWRLCFCL